MTYVLLNGFVLLALALTFVVVKPAITLKKFMILLGSMLLLTLVFDNLIIALHIVSYHSAHILGVYLGKAPIEDFAYTFAACLLVPMLWKKDKNVE